MKTFPQEIMPKNQENRVTTVVISRVFFPAVHLHICICVPNTLSAGNRAEEGGKWRRRGRHRPHPAHAALGPLRAQGQGRGAARTPGCAPEA